ncbi:MAG: hypothetical protein IK955_06025 [Clostridia bacterium]|nr:hypothetical protein [Clostridia bacterium]
MENNNQTQNIFSYTYSAKEQAELKKIRDKYDPPVKTEDKMSRLRRLDAEVSSKATRVALVIGIIGTLVMGFGMSLIMTDIGAFFGEIPSMVIGIVTGIIGIALVCLAYPVYNKKLKKEREKIAPEILRLTDELMK